MTREHVISEWLSRELLKDAPPDAKFRAVGAVSGGKRIDYASQLIDVVARATCHDCNHGWIHDDDTGVKDILLPAMKGERVRLSRVRRAQLVRWVCTKIMVDEFASQGRGPEFFLAQERRNLMESGTIPGSVNLWAVRVSSGAGWVGCHDIEPAGMSGQRVAYAASLAVGQIAFLLFADRDRPGSAKTAIDIIGRTLDGPAMLLLPQDRDHVRWPPRHSMPRAHLPGLMTLWHQAPIWERFDWPGVGLPTHN